MSKPKLDIQDKENWFRPKVYKGISMHEQEMRSIRYKLAQLLKTLKKFLCIGNL